MLTRGALRKIEAERREDIVMARQRIQVTLQDLADARKRKLTEQHIEGERQRIREELIETKRRRQELEEKIAKLDFFEPSDDVRDQIINLYQEMYAMVMEVEDSDELNETGSIQMFRVYYSLKRFCDMLCKIDQQLDKQTLAVSCEPVEQDGTSGAEMQKAQGAVEGEAQELVIDEGSSDTCMLV
jgi:membrane-associated HD superfamily phosphohydrolase